MLCDSSSFLALDNASLSDVICASERTGEAVFGRSVFDRFSDDGPSGFSGRGCCGGGAGGSEKRALRLMSLIGEILIGFIGDAFVDSFLGSVESILFMY